VRLDPSIRSALEATGKAWEIVEGRKHHQIRLDGRLVGILPKGSGTSDPRAVKNSITQIRRAAAGLPLNRRTPK
jgi:hypothetical protein